MDTRGFLLFLLSGFSVAILCAVFINKNTMHHNSTPLHSPHLSNADRVWPELELNWRLVLATVIGFLGSACGTVGGVGGGGIFVPMLTLIVGFDTKSAAAISKCMIMGASASSFWYNLLVPHPTKEVPIIDYDLALLFQPMLMLGITVGVSLSVVFPYWLITVLIIILFLGTSSRSFYKGTEMWKEETILKKELTRQQATPVNSKVIDAEYDLLATGSKRREIRTEKLNQPPFIFQQILCFNLRWKRLWNDLVACSTLYWVMFCLQFPIAVLVFGYEATKLYKEHKKRMSTGKTEAICHLLLEIGVIPQVASATATFVMMFSSSLSVVEFYLLKRFPIPYALYLMGVSVLAGFWGQCLVRKVISILKRASIIVFILSGVIFASALTMGVIGIETSIQMTHNHEFMGFLDFCSSR
ncbi:hypothetical protein PTKIN_Ptkin06aG0049800 [Pterospermum kingtungense]